MDHNDSGEDYSHIDSGEKQQDFGEIEAVVAKRLSLRQEIAIQMRKSGIQCEVLEKGSHPLESKPYYSYLFPFTSRLVTNRGLIKVVGKRIDFVQLLQRN